MAKSYILPVWFFVAVFTDMIVYLRNGYNVKHLHQTWRGQRYVTHEEKLYLL